MHAILETNKNDVMIKYVNNNNNNKNVIVSKLNLIIRKIMWRM